MFRLSCWALLRRSDSNWWPLCRRPSGDAATEAKVDADADPSNDAGRAVGRSGWFCRASCSDRSAMTGQSTRHRIQSVNWTPSISSAVTARPSRVAGT